MKRIFALLLCLMTFAACTAGLAEATADLSAYSDDDLLALLALVQQEVASRHIEKTAQLPAGTYVGGRDLPLGSYVITGTPLEGQCGIISLAAAEDPADEYPSKLYEFVDEDPFTIYITVEEGDVLVLPYAFEATISGGVMFR